MCVRQLYAGSVAVQVRSWCHSDSTVTYTRMHVSLASKYRYGTLESTRRVDLRETHTASCPRASATMLARTCDVDCRQTAILSMDSTCSRAQPAVRSTLLPPRPRCPSLCSRAGCSNRQHSRREGGRGCDPNQPGPKGYGQDDPEWGRGGGDHQRRGNHPRADAGARLSAPFLAGVRSTLYARRTGFVCHCVIPRACRTPSRFFVLCVRLRCVAPGCVWLVVSPVG